MSRSSKQAKVHSLHTTHLLLQGLIAIAPRHCCIKGSRAMVAVTAHHQLLQQLGIVDGEEHIRVLVKRRAGGSCPATPAATAAVAEAGQLERKGATREGPAAASAAAVAATEGPTPTSVQQGAAERVVAMRGTPFGQGCSRGRRSRAALGREPQGNAAHTGGASGGCPSTTLVIRVIRILVGIGIGIGGGIGAAAPLPFVLGQLA